LTLIYCSLSLSLPSLLIITHFIFFCFSLLFFCFLYLLLFFYLPPLLSASLNSFLIVFIPFLILLHYFLSLHYNFYSTYPLLSAFICNSLCLYVSPSPLLDPFTPVIPPSLSFYSYDPPFFFLFVIYLSFYYFSTFTLHLLNYPLSISFLFMPLLSISYLLPLPCSLYSLSFCTLLDLLLLTLFPSYLL